MSYKCSSKDGKMNPEARKCIDRYRVQSQFRSMYPDKAKALQGMTIPSSVCDSLRELIAYADEKIRNKQMLVDQEKEKRRAMGAPDKFDRYGKYKY